MLDGGWPTQADLRTSGPQEHALSTMKQAASEPRAATMAGLVVGALGILILWTSGVEFPFYPPPGIIILLFGMLFVGLARWPWAPAVGAFLGLFVTVGFLISPTGLSNLAGEAGTSVAIGQGTQVIGVVTALIAGVIATRANYRALAQGRP
jgi:hypothetical protein